MKQELVVRTMEGLGDNLWSRPHVLALSRLYDLVLLTPWPQAYVDIPGLRFGRPSTRLRTQSENVRRWETAWTSSATEAAFRLAYSPHEIRAGANHHDSLEASARQWLGDAGVSPLDIRMEVPDEWLDLADELIAGWTKRRGHPVVMIRPPTIRTEWRNPARNCSPAALQTLINALKKDFTLVSFAHLKPREEWLAAPLHGLDFQLHSGELSVEALFGLAARCWTIGANGFSLPMALATGGWAYILFGGNYGYNAPDRLLHSAYPAERIGFSEPDRPCRGCTRPSHACNTQINASRLIAEFGAWQRRQQTDEVEMGGALRATTFGREYYEEHKAAGLDYLGHGEWQRRYGRWFSDTLGWRGRRVLDVGCACGSIVRGLRSGGVQAYGIDVNEHMIRLGQRQWPEMASRLLVGDAANLHAFRAAQFDGLHCAQVAEHFQPELVPTILQECRRITKPGGLFWLCMDTEELYARQGRRVETEDPTHVCVKPMQWWKERAAEAGWEDVTPHYLPKLRSHSMSMLEGSSSGSPAKYDWDFLVLRASDPQAGWGRVVGDVESVAIVATGPSLKALDVRQLKGVPVVAVNQAINHLAEAPMAWATVDTALPQRALMRRRHNWPKTQFYAAVPDDYGMPNATATNRRGPREPGITYLRRVEPNGEGLSLDPTRIVVGNSSYGALNIAFLMGAKRVALLGVDGTGGYAWGSGRPKNLRNLRDLFGQAKWFLEERGVEVVVGSPQSVVDWWPRMGPVEALHWLRSAAVVQ